MAHKHSVYDTDAHFSINPFTRAIKNESTSKVAVIQHDHNSERFTFEIPRRVDGHDMSVCDRVEVHYINMDSTNAENISADIYEVDDLQVSPDDSGFVICSWLLSQNATKYAGSLNFLVRFICLADDETVAYAWHTAVFTGISVSSGILNNAEEIIEPFPDVLAQWKADLFGVGDTQEQRLLTVSAEQQAAITAEGQKQLEAVAGKCAAVLDSIPDEYEAVSALADQNHRNKAGAIVLDAEGESIVVNDSSEYPLQGLKVFGKSEQLTTTGKNLVNLPQTIEKPSSGYNYDLFTGTVGVATSVNEADLDKLPVLAPGTYYFHVEIETAGSTEVKVQSVADDGTTAQDKLIVNKPGSFTLTEETRITFRAGTADTATIKNLQIEIGNQYTGYEPYSGGVASPSPEWAQEINSIENAALTVYGKNLIPPRVVTWEYAGLTFTGNDDGTVSVAGTVNSDEDSTFHVVLKDSPLTLPKGDYLLSGIQDGSEKTYRILIYKTDWTFLTECTDGSKPFSLDQTTDVFVYIWVARGTTINKTFHPMIRLASVEDGAFDTYKKQAFSIPRTLPGIPVTSGGNYTDADGQQWICDEVDLARGVYVQRVGSTTINTASAFLDNSAVDGSGVFYAFFEGYDQANGALGMLSDKLTFQGALASNADAMQMLQHGSLAYLYNLSAVRRIYFAISGVTTLDEATAWLADNAPVICYPIEAPIETPLSDAEITAFKALHSNKPVTTILNDAGAFMAVEYVADTKTYIDNKIAALLSNET